MKQLKFTASLKPLSDSGRAGRKSIWVEVMTYRPSAAQRSECYDREPNISGPVRPNSVNKHFIVWLISVGNFDFFFLKYDARDLRAHINDSTIQTFPFWFRVRTGKSYFIEKRGICLYFCSLMSLIICHNSGRSILFLYFLYKCTGAERLFPDRETVSWGFPNGPVKLLCSPSRWRFQKFWKFYDKTIS